VVAEARLANAQAALDAAQAQLESLEVKAPFSGTVAAVDVHPGEWVIAGQPVLSLADLDNLQIETTDLSERDVPRVEVGQPAIVFIEALGQEVEGQVESISPLADTLGGDVVYKTTVSIGQLPPGIRAGMSVEVQFIGD
jgi:RND family efflux transporter MFP subunit